METRNRLKITCPDETPAYLEVCLNGQKVERLISLRVEVPEGDGTPLVRVSLCFYSALEVDAVLEKMKTTLKTIQLSA